MGAGAPPPLLDGRSKNNVGTDKKNRIAEKRNKKSYEMTVALIWTIP